MLCYSSMHMHGFETATVAGVEILKSMHVHATVAEHTRYAREGKRRARLGKLLLQRSTATVGMLYRFWYVTGLTSGNLRCV